MSNFEWRRTIELAHGEIAGAARANVSAALGSAVRAIPAASDHHVMGKRVHRAIATFARVLPFMLGLGIGIIEGPNRYRFRKLTVM